MGKIFESALVQDRVCEARRQENFPLRCGCLCDPIHASSVSCLVHRILGLALADDCRSTRLAQVLRYVDEDHRARQLGYRGSFGWF